MFQISDKIILCLSPKTVKHFACISTQYRRGCSTFVETPDEKQCCRSRQKVFSPLCITSFKVALLCNVIAICGDHTYTYRLTLRQCKHTQTHTQEEQIQSPLTQTVLTVAAGKPVHQTIPWAALWSCYRRAPCTSKTKQYNIGHRV